MRTIRKAAKFRVRPINIRNGNTAPYFIIEPEPKAKRDEIEKLAQETFASRSTLARYSNWQPSIDKI